MLEEAITPVFLPKLVFIDILSFVECKAVGRESMARPSWLLEVALVVGVGLITDCVAVCHFPARRLLAFLAEEKHMAEKAFHMWP